jgi:lipoprotein-anchoring transpeptidase ErfK/SrfK
MGEPCECGIPENRLADPDGRAYHRSAVVIRGAPCPTHVRVGAAVVALAALALVLPPPAAADPFSEGPGLSQRPRTVKAVQRKLAELGFLARSGVDGVFGAQSQGAVIAFQKWEGLVRDGSPGPITQRALADAKRPVPLTRGRGTRVEIALDRQVLLLVRRGRVARVVHASTGRGRFATPTGEHAVFRKRRRAFSVPYKVWLPYASFFVGGIAIHQSGSVPVRPASHGCVRVTRYDAKWLYRRTPLGTPVTVLASSR